MCFSDTGVERLFPKEFSGFGVDALEGSFAAIGEGRMQKKMIAPDNWCRVPDIRKG